MDARCVMRVRQRIQAGRPHIDAFETAMERANRTKGFFVAFDFSSGDMTEIDRFFRKTGKVVAALTVREVLDEEIEKKLA